VDFGSFYERLLSPPLSSTKAVEERVPRAGDAARYSGMATMARLGSLAEKNQLLAGWSLRPRTGALRDLGNTS